jgi:hypothetical protein
MNGRLPLHALLVVLVVAAPGWLGLQDCRATSIQDIIDNNNSKITVGNLTFAFTEKSVTSDPATPPPDVIFTPPTTSSVDVTTVAGGLTFSFNPFLSLTTALAITQNIYITYTVTSTNNIGGAGLSFSGLAVDINTKSDVMETFTGQAETLEVYSMKDSGGKVTGQNNQSTTFANPQMTLSVTDNGILTTGVRGNGEKSTAQLSEITNTFSTIPEPASIVSATTGVLFVLGAWYRNRRRTAA